MMNNVIKREDKTSSKMMLKDSLIVNDKIGLMFHKVTP